MNEVQVIDQLQKQFEASKNLIPNDFDFVLSRIDNQASILYDGAVVKRRMVVFELAKFISKNMKVSLFSKEGITANLKRLGEKHEISVLQTNLEQLRVVLRLECKILSPMEKKAFNDAIRMIGNSFKQEKELRVVVKRYENF